MSIKNHGLVVSLVKLRSLEALKLVDLQVRSEGNRYYED